jgi:hypothetical protein
MFNDFPRTKLTKAATVTLKHSRSCGLRSRIWMRSRVQAFEIQVIPTFPPDRKYTGSPESSDRFGCNCGTRRHNRGVAYRSAGLKHHGVVTKTQTMKARSTAARRQVKIEIKLIRKLGRN